MSSTGTRTIIWANGEDQFCLAKTGLILELEDKCGSIGSIFKKLEDGTWGLTILREVIRLALIGGGKSPEAAMKIVKRHVDPDNGNPLTKSVLIAYSVIAAVMVGVPDDPVGKKPAADAKTDQVSSTTTVASAAQPSSESAEVSGGHQAAPMTAPSGSLPPSSRDTTAPTRPTNNSPSN